jgi:hypothetical protein
MRTYIALLTLLICAVSALAADGVRCIPNSVIATFDPGDPIHHLATTNNLAYVLESTEGIHILDFSDPTSPLSIAFIPQPNSVRALTVCGNLLFAANTSTGIEIYNVNDPAKPTLTGTIPHTGVISDIVVNNTLLYYLHSGTLRIADIANPANPTSLGSYAMGGVTGGMHVTQHTAYVAASHAGLYIIDISAPTFPNLHRRIDIPWAAEDVLINDHYAYVLSDNGLQNHNGHVRTYNVSNLKNPTLISELLIPGRPRRFIQRDSTIYIANAGNGVLALDASNPQAPSTLGLLGDMNGNYERLAFASNHLLAASDSTGLKVINSYAFVDPLFSETTTPRSPQRSTLDGDTLYVANAEHGLTIYDTHDKANPTLLSTTDTPGTARDVAVEHTTALVADGDTGLHLLDITDPFSPQAITTYATRGAARALTTYFGLAYLATDLGLEIVNFSDPANPFQVSFLSLPKAHHLALGPGVVYVACDDLGLHIVNTLNPATPQAIGYYNENNYNARNITVDANRIFVSNYHNDNNGWLEVFDVTNPANPTVTDVVGYGEDGAFFHNDLLYTIQRNELSILDPNTPRDATHIASYPLTHRAGYVLVDHDYAYITSPDASTLSIISTGQCACDADFDADGQLTSSDVTAFLAAFMSQSPQADLNRDTRYNFFDISAYIESFLAGCP